MPSGILNTPQRCTWLGVQVKISSRALMINPRRAQLSLRCIPSRTCGGRSGLQKKTSCSIHQFLKKRVINIEHINNSMIPVLCNCVEGKKHYSCLFSIIVCDGAQFSPWTWSPLLAPEVLSDDMMQRRMRCGLCIFAGSRKIFANLVACLSLNQNEFYASFFSLIFTDIFQSQDPTH